MKAQQEIVTLFFKRSDLVRFLSPWKGVLGQVEAESNGRPGFYYVRELHSGELHLVAWYEIEKAGHE